ncbi:MAG: PEP/pyruvate-binding domain-containing protein [Methanobacteriota archaeon]
MQIQFNDSEKKIIDCIKEITGITPPVVTEKEQKDEKPVEPVRINHILLLCSSYHYFQIEEEGRLRTLLNEWHRFHIRETTPEITHVETKEECIDAVKKQHIDLVIIFGSFENTGIFALAQSIKKIEDIPIVVLGNNIAQLSDLAKKNTDDLLQKIVTWNGDGKIILTLVQYLNDAFALHHDPVFAQQCRCLLLIEDSIQYYSTYLLLLYDEIDGFLAQVMQDDLSEEQRRVRVQRRPIILHAQTVEEVQILYTKYKGQIFGIITDNHLDTKNNTKTQDGLTLAKQITKDNPRLPILIQSSEPLPNNEQLSENIQFIPKQTATLALIIKDFINTHLGPRDITLKNAKGKNIVSIQNIKDLEGTLLSNPDISLHKAAHQHVFSTWLAARGEQELAEKIHQAEQTITKESELRKRIIDILEEHKYAQTQASVTPFERTTIASHLEIHRIGKGALGGKARGLSFLAKLVSKYISDEMFPNLRITVPRTIVLSTDVFETFMSQNNLYDPLLYDLPDERIALKFMSGNLPATVLGDLRSFIQKTRKPLVVRSSGVLEDSLLQSFAGIYDSILLPNESWETDFRFQEVCNAIKYVYASTYFEKARTYIKSTPKNLGDEKMAVIIQDVVGQKHETYFYPVISGVAKSYNYYPSGGCRQEDGIVYLALGLGKAIVDGGCSFCFCPERPTTPLFGTPKDFMRYAQRKFYALNLKSIYKIVERNEETSYKILEIEDAKHHGVLEKVASTYVRQDDHLYPGIYEEGSVVIDFGPITQYEILPLAKALKLLLRISEIALGYPVEIEFAVNISATDSQKADLVILQIRSMLPPGKGSDISIEEYTPGKDLCYSENALGNGVIEGIQDIVYVKSDFTMANSVRAVEQIRKINKKLMEEHKPYLLVGPGRWGSADQWLGIPVIWSDIAGTKVIVETPSKERTIDPSQGSHFFHDLISSQVGYLITKEGKGNIDFNWLDTLSCIDDQIDVRHAQIPYPLVVKIDGKQGKAVIQPGKGINNCIK